MAHREAVEGVQPATVIIVSMHSDFADTVKT